MEKPISSINKLKASRPDIGQYLDVPEYLSKTYWWAYLHPLAVKFFERQWLVNLILWGNYRRLRDELISDIQQPFQGKLLQLACVYGDFTQRLATCLSDKGQLDVVDVARVQLENTKAKVGENSQIHFHKQDTSDLNFKDGSFDTTVLFFLLHEQPEPVRQATILEAFRVTRDGGSIIIVDYHKAKAWNPLRHFMAVVFQLLEPYTKAFINRQITDYFPNKLTATSTQKKTYFGGLYQKIRIVR